MTRSASAGDPTRRVFLAGGGTGGHITPALAVAAALHAARPDLEVEFVGTPGGMESRLVPAAGWTLHQVAARPLRRRLSLDLVRAPLGMLLAARRLRRLLRARGVVAACAFGGYTAGPLALAARMARIPLVLHEQNAVPGLANRIAARWAAAIAVTVEATVARFPRRARVEVTGNPVRRELAAVNLGELRDEALSALGLEPDRRTLLAFGGSQGARRINDALLDSAGRWESPDRVQVLHVTGAREETRVRTGWERASERLGGLLVRCVDFVERMDLAYAAADVAVCRAGASTVAELTLAGLPSLLVPYPFATADHQTANADSLAEAGAARRLADADLDGARLVAAVEPMLLDDDLRAAMSAAARRMARPDAADRVAALVLEVAGGRQGAA